MFSVGRNSRSVSVEGPGAARPPLFSLVPTEVRSPENIWGLMPHTILNLFSGCVTAAEAASLLGDLLDLQCDRWSWHNLGSLLGDAAFGLAVRRSVCKARRGACLAPEHIGSPLSRFSRPFSML